VPSAPTYLEGDDSALDARERTDFNSRNIAEFRSSGGTVGSFGDAPLLLLTTIGAKTGKLRTSPTMYLADERDPDRVYVFASAAGADDDPRRTRLG
jgi:F420H(2)-dependent quinone reductase